jgi:glycosyltransferase involved in cell wall biosynthesis
MQSRIATIARGMSVNDSREPEAVPAKPPQYEDRRDAVVRDTLSSPNRPIVCFSANDWDDIPSSKFHIMRHLGKSRKVLYVDTIGLRRPRLSSKDAKRALSKLTKAALGMRHVETNVYVCSPLAIPYHDIALARWCNSYFVSGQIKRYVRKLGMVDPIVWSYLPNAIGIIEKLPYTQVIYHCIDDYRDFTGVPKLAMDKMERKILQRADVTVVSAKALLNSKGPHARKIAYVPHGVNVEEFGSYLSAKPDLKDINRLGKPIAGLVGRIADWVDLPLIMRCAKELPHWTFVMVGPSNVELSSFLNAPNVHFLGKKDYKEVPHYIQSFDVCLMPYRNIARIATANPLKMYEYLALGKPIVTVPVDEVSDFAHLLTIAAPSEFSAAIEKAHADDTDRKRTMRIQSVSGRSWGDVADSIVRLVS